MVLQLGIAGINGRMGQALKAVAAKDDRVRIAAEGNRQMPVAQLAAAAEALIDFTQPAYSLELARAAAEQNKIHVIGTTGFSDAEMQQIKKYAGQTPIVWSANMSLGVNVVASLVEQTARVLGVEYDIEIGEMHHRHKKDAPSGTALMLAAAAAKGRGAQLSDVERMYRKGMIGEREKGTIGMSVRRGGDVVGEHEVCFAGEGEVIEISHRGFSREIYARGAIAAALWAQGKPAGLYSMRDVLGLG